MLGVGGYIGGGEVYSVGNSVGSLPSGWSTITSFHGEANVGWGPSYGGSLDYPGGSIWDSSVGLSFRAGGGLGAMLGVGPGYAATYATPTFGQMWDNALGWFSGTPDSSSGYSPDSANLDALGFSITSNLYGIDYAFSSCGFGTDTSSYSDGSGDPSP